MDKINSFFRPIALLAMGLALCHVACKNKTRAAADANPTEPGALALSAQISEPPLALIPVEGAIEVRDFFQYIDGIVQRYDTLQAYTLSEYLLLRANPWIIDTLVSTDYYYQMSLGNFVYDQPQMRLLKQGDTLLIPGPKTAAALQEKMAQTWLDVNIPAFRMRIMEGDRMVFEMPVRVGKNTKKYLELAGHSVDLRTRTGEGAIMRVNRNPLFIDPVTGKKFKFTKRDDHRTTLMPQIPWLEPVINGQRYGQMIHPTTNPRTLGKPASNGCIGVGEADAWRVYCYAPVGTRVSIRYDLLEISPRGDTLRYEDVYQLRRSGKTGKAIAVAGQLPESTAGICLCDSLF